jgi:AcrR family transcriptional regulator
MEVWSMRATRRDGEETRGRILAAASAVFARGGYREATVQQIAEEAECNHAAINYHFGSKEELYREVWVYARENCLRTYPIDGDSKSEVDPETQLRRFMRSLIMRSFDPGPAGHFSRLMAYEITDPRPALAEVRIETIELHESRFNEIVRAILGPDADQETLRLCRLTIMAPCVGVGIRMVRHPDASEVAQLRRINPGALADGISRFAWVGLQDLKQRATASRTSTDRGEQ